MAGLFLVGMTIQRRGLFAQAPERKSLWFRVFRYGPLEWLWRAGTRTTFTIPFRR